MEKVIAYLRLLRPANALIAFLAVVVIAFIAEKDYSIIPMQVTLLAAFSVSLICGASNVINDYFDVEIDRINRPDRPLASGLISRGAAMIWWLTVVCLGVALSFYISTVCFVIAIASAAGLFLYSSHLKRTPLWGNLTVSFFNGLAFLYGGLAIGRVERATLPAVFAFLFHLGREIVKDMEDREGDHRVSARTFPIVYGFRTAKVAVMVVFLLLIFVTTLAFTQGYYGYFYMIVVGAGIYPVVAYSLISIWRFDSTKNLHRMSNLLKIGMLIGLVALYLG